MAKRKKRKLYNKYDDKIYEILLNKSRIIYLYGDIDDEIAEEVNKKIRGFSLQHPKKPIILEINSGGGSISSGISIIDTMNNINTPVWTIIRGEACSMAAIISIMGDKRFASRYSSWMSHAGSTYIYDKIQNAYDRVRYEKHLEEITNEMLKSHTKLTKQDIEKQINGELWYNAEDMRKKGVIDEIITKES